jgi:hypothetical protein
MDACSIFHSPFYPSPSLRRSAAPCFWILVVIAIAKLSCVEIKTRVDMKIGHKGKERENVNHNRLYVKQERFQR